MKFAIITSIISGALLCGNFSFYDHKTGVMQGMSRNLKNSMGTFTGSYSFIQEYGVEMKHNEQIRKRLQNAAPKLSLAKFTSNNNLTLPIIKRDILAKTNSTANSIIPIVDSNQNDKSGGNLGSPSTNDTGMGGGGGKNNPTTSVVDSSNSNGNDNSTIIYISQYGGNNVISCNVIKTPYNISVTNGASNDSGKTPTGIANCNPIIGSANNIEGPDNLLVYNNNIYVVNSENKSVTSCNLSKSGGINNCNNFIVPVAYPMFITQVSAQQLYIYGTPNSQNIAPAASCTTDNNGNIISCGNAFTINVSSLPYPVVDGYTYTTNYNKSVVNKCIGQTCQYLNDILISGPTAIATTSNSAYIISDTSLVGCGIDRNSGNFFNCSILNNNLNDSEGVAIYNINNDGSV